MRMLGEIFERRDNPFKNLCLLYADTNSTFLQLIVHVHTAVGHFLFSDKVIFKTHVALPRSLIFICILKTDISCK